MGICSYARIRLFVSIFIVGVFVAFFSSSAQAQSFTSLLSGGGISLSSQPSFPLPLYPVSVSLETPGLNLAGSNIAWYVDGVEFSEGKNMRSITFTTGEVGTKHTVRAQITNNGGVSQETSHSFVTTKVDVVLEADTVVPLLYKGKPLPTPQGSVRAIALLHGFNGDATTYGYDWRLDNNSLYGGPVQGKPFMEFEVPPFGRHRLSVQVYDRRGTLVGGGGVEVAPVQPELYFYEEHALSGMNMRALTADFILEGDETTIVASPYYTDNTNGGAAVHSYMWSLNGDLVSATGDRPNTLTLRPVGEGEGSARVDCRLSVDRTIPQQVSNSFTIYYKK